MSLPTSRALLIRALFVSIPVAGTAYLAVADEPPPKDGARSQQTNTAVDEPPSAESTPGTITATEFCKAVVPQLDQSTCIAKLNTVRRQIAAGDVTTAVEALAELNVFDESTSCEGSLPGGLCTAKEWRAAKTREVFTNPDALKPAARPLRNMIEQLRIVRQHVVDNHLAAARQRLAEEDFESARKEYGTARALGAADEEVHRQLLQNEVATVLDEQKRRAEQEGPKFRDGSTSWYATPVYNATVRRAPDQCAAKFGAGTEVNLRVDPKPWMISCTKETSHYATEEELARIKKAHAENQLLPPTRRRPLPEVWTAAAVTGERVTCPPGMKPKTELIIRDIVECITRSAGTDADWDRCRAFRPAGYKSDSTPLLITKCEAFLTDEEYCPGGKLNWMERTCSTLTCPPGLDRLDKATEGHLSGCYKCPLGTLDLRESIAAVGQDFAIAMSAGRLPRMSEVLCRVGPPKKPTRAQKPKP